MTRAHSSTYLVFLPSPPGQDTLGHVCPPVRGRQASYSLFCPRNPSEFLARPQEHAPVAGPLTRIRTQGSLPPGTGVKYVPLAPAEPGQRFKVLAQDNIYCHAHPPTHTQPPLLRAHAPR